MEFIISESKINDAIRTYLDINVIPDYGWGDKTFYKEEIGKYKIHDFIVNDNVAYTYYGNELKWIPENSIEFQKSFYERLNQLFGKFWIPVFKEWFEENTGLGIKKFNFL